jgi:pyridoxal phosphate enzyme (YggS family)
MVRADQVSSAARIADNLNEIEARISRAAESVGRDRRAIRLVAVSKMQPAEVVREALSAGVRELGENYVQEAESKLAALGAVPATRHLLGHLQRNKAGKAAALFDMVQTVDRREIAEALGRRALALGKVLDVLVEVNISGEPGKFGVAPGLALAMAEDVAQVPGVRLQGLMGIGPLATDERRTRESFRVLAKLFGELAPEFRQVLSMGMTGDFELAIEEGSTMVRVGTGIFGARRSAE